VPDPDFIIVIVLPGGTHRVHTPLSTFPLFHTSTFSTWPPGADAFHGSSSLKQAPLPTNMKLLNFHTLPGPTIAGTTGKTQKTSGAFCLLLPN